MEWVEGLLKNLKLSGAHRKGVRISVGSGKGVEAGDPQAIGKLMSKKLAHPKALIQALGRI